MARDSIFGFKKGMSIEDINLVSEKEAQFANEHTDKLLEVFPSEIDFDVFNKYHIKLNDDSKIDEFRLLAYDVDQLELPGKLNSIFEYITENYGSYNSSTSADLNIFEYEPASLMESLNSNPDGYVFLWDEGINSDYLELIKNIKLTVKADNDNTGFLCVEIAFNNSVIKTEGETISEDTTLDSDLLDGEDEDTVYENESNYVESEEKQDSPEIIEQEDHLEQKSEIESAPQSKTTEYQEESTYSETENKRFPISISNFVCYAVMLIVWIGFLWEPIGRTFKDKQDGSWINVFYYFVYFSYTLIACGLPFFIKNNLNKFAASEKKGKKSSCNR